MSAQNTGSIWLAIAVIIVGIGSLLLFGLQPSHSSAGRASNLQGTPVALAAVGSQLGVVATPTVLPTKLAEAPVTPTRTPLPPLALPAVPTPADGQVYLLTPISADGVGWAQAEDEKPNHFGDYNIYAGVFDGKQHIGAVQFDLSTIPPGSPVLYADLTLTGLSAEWLGGDGVWTAQPNISCYCTR